MIKEVSLEESRATLAGLQAAATAIQTAVPTQAPSVAEVWPDADTVRAIGRDADNDAFRGSSPDLQALLDSLLLDFGNRAELSGRAAASQEARENQAEAEEAVERLGNVVTASEEMLELLDILTGPRMENAPAESASPESQLPLEERVPSLHPQEEPAKDDLQGLEARQSRRVESAEQDVEIDRTQLTQAQRGRAAGDEAVAEAASSVIAAQSRVLSSDSRLGEAQQQERSSEREVQQAESVFARAERRIQRAQVLRAPDAELTAQDFQQRAAALESAARISHTLARFGTERAAENLQRDEQEVRQREEDRQTRLEQQELVRQAVELAERNLAVSLKQLESERELASRVRELLNLS